MELKVNNNKCKKFLQKIIQPNIGIIIYLFVMFLVVFLSFVVNPSDSIYAQQKKQYFKEVEKRLKEFDPKTEKENINIVLWHNISGSESEIFTDIINNFEKKFPKIKVIHMSKGNWDQLHKNLNSVLITDQYPNLAFCYTSSLLAYNYSHKLLPFDELIQYDPEINNSLDSKFKEIKAYNFEGKDVVGYNKDNKDKEIYSILWDQTILKFSEDDKKKIYSLPFFKTKEVFYYNKTYFNKHQEKLKEIFSDEEKEIYKEYFENNSDVEREKIPLPLTWQHIEKISAKIKEIESSESLKKIIPIMNESVHNLFLNYYFTDLFMKTGKVPDISDRIIENFFLHNQDAKNILQYFKDNLIDKEYFTNKRLMGIKDYVSLFLNQEVYMLLDSSRKQLMNQKQELNFTLGIAPVPIPFQKYNEDKEKNKDKQKLANYLNKYKTLQQGPNLCLFNKKDIKEVLASWCFMKYLLFDSEVGEKLLKSGMFPSVKSFVTNFFDKNISSKNTNISEQKKLEYQLINLIHTEFSKDKTFYLPFCKKINVFRDSLGYLMMDYFFTNFKDSPDIDRNKLFNFYHDYIVSSK